MTTDHTQDRPRLPREPRLKRTRSPGEFGAGLEPPSFGQQMIDGLREFADCLKAGVPLEKQFRVTYVNRKTGERIVSEPPKEPDQ